MNKNKIVKSPYLSPCIEVCPMSVENPMLESSPIGGGHNDAEDDEGLSARQSPFFGEDDIWESAK